MFLCLFHISKEWMKSIGQKLGTGELKTVILNKTRTRMHCCCMACVPNFWANKPKHINVSNRSKRAHKRDHTNHRWCAIFSNFISIFPTKNISSYFLLVSKVMPLASHQLIIGSMHWFGCLLPFTSFRGPRSRSTIMQHILWSGLIVNIPLSTGLTLNISQHEPIKCVIIE